MKEIIAYEMSFMGTVNDKDEITCVPFQEKHWDAYMQMYNEGFCEMREALEIEPVNFYSDYAQMKDKADNTFLYMQNGEIAGAISCYENEIDDLVVKQSFQRRGIGQKLLLWGMKHINEKGYKEIILHVAEWNQNAVKLYLKNGFRIKKKERVR